MFGYLRTKNKYVSVDGINVVLTKDPIIKWKILINASSTISIEDGSKSIDIWDPAKPNIILYNTNEKVNQKWIIKYIFDDEFIISHIKAKGYINISEDNKVIYSEEPGYFTFVDFDKLAVISFNLGYNVIRDKLQGSERKLVKKCQNNYGQTGFFSRCSKNAIDYIAKLEKEPDVIYDLFLLQEISYSSIKKVTSHFAQAIENTDKKAKFYHHFSLYFGNWAVVLMYNQTIFGNGVNLLDEDGKYFILIEQNDARAFQCVWFEKVGLVVINLHAPHDIDLVTAIEEKGKEIEIIHPYVKPKRVIMGGDFNDFNGTISKQSVLMFGHELKLISKPPKSCCEDSSYKYVGDYIFDSKEPSNSSYFGFPSKYERYNPIMSDHDPVVLIN